MSRKSLIFDFFSKIQQIGRKAKPACFGGIPQKLLAWVEQHLLKELRLGDVVIMDNLSRRKVKGVAEALESVAV